MENHNTTTKSLDDTNHKFIYVYNTKREYGINKKQETVTCYLYSSAEITETAKEEFRANIEERITKQNKELKEYFDNEKKEQQEAEALKKSNMTIKQRITYRLFGSLRPFC